MTDEGNYILDCRFEPPIGPNKITAIERRAGIIEHGIWTGLATDVIVAGRRGARHLRRQEEPGKASWIKSE